jgi:hypothetical protein
VTPGAFRIGACEAFTDPPLECAACGETVCTVQYDDDLDVLVRTAADHTCNPRPGNETTTEA